MRARIPRTWYCFQSVDHGYGDLYFIMHNFGLQIIHFKIREIRKKFIEGKKNTAKSVHGARYSMMQIKP